MVAAVLPADRLSPHDGAFLPPSRLYVEPRGAPFEQMRAYEATGRAADAALIRRIAENPAAAWFADESPGYAARARSLAVNAAAVGRLPVIVLYHVPHRDCSGQSAGGAASDSAYRAWVLALSQALDGQRAIVIIEPDAVAQTLQGCRGATGRFALLSDALRTLSAHRGLKLYLDAGNSAWITDTTRMARALKRAGVGHADGFALNVANFETTKDTIAYGVRLSAKLGGAPFVIDTSRNGNGPAAKGHHHWCNPPGRALGEAPTLATGQPLVDAYLWVKRPGESDGACGRGAPAAGVWWPSYALSLARG